MLPKPPARPSRSELGSPRKVMSNLRGRFLDGVWHCDCDPRLPAEHFQTKNRGVNHGRWFYTCQKPQHKRCKFFLWEDDAKQREKFSILPKEQTDPGQSGNQYSVSEDRHLQTPTRKQATTTRNQSGLLTPQTGHRTIKPEFGEFLYSIPTTKSDRIRGRDEGSGDDVGWDDDDIDSEVERILQREAQQPVFQPETPRKTPRTSKITSPGRGQRPPSIFSSNSDEVNPAGSPTRNVHDPPHSPARMYPRLSPSTSPVHSSDSQFIAVSGNKSHYIPQIRPLSVELSSTSTPLQYAPSVNMSSNHRSPFDTPSSIALETLAILDRHNVVVSDQVKDELIAHLDRHDLRTQGIIKGREVSRIALKKKDDQIRMLNARIEGLEAEKEMDRALITGLKSGGGSYGSQM